MASKFNISASGNVMVGDNMNVEISASGSRNSDSKQQPKMVIHRTNSASTQIDTQDGSGVQHKITKGFALILHNRYFPEGSLTDREGSEHDVLSIKEFCDRANLEIYKNQNTENLSASQIGTLCSDVAERDFTSYDAFVCFILSHGKNGCVYGTDNETIRIEDIVSKFKNIPTLVEKPKLFFIQACRGKNKDDGIVADHGDKVEKADPLRLPSESDILIAHSTSRGYESYRNREVGSWFIITLISMLHEYAHKMHLVDILTLVNHAISKYETPDGRKQMPCQASTLTKFVYFTSPTP